MELTAETFRQLEDSLDFKQSLALKAALGRNQLGLIPGYEFESDGVFVKNAFEINNFKCLALLPSGKVINASQEVSINIPMLYGEEYYLGVTILNERHEFERERVAIYRSLYGFALYTLEELKKKDVFPVVKFFAKDSVLSVCPQYIVPCLFISENKRFENFNTKYIQQLEIITSHTNLENGDGKRSLMRYLFILKSLDPKMNVVDYVSQLQEMVHAIDYFIVIPNTESHKDIPLPDYYDIEKWLEWIVSYMQGAKNVLDKVVLEDNTIDYNALLEEAGKNLYERLRPELLEKLPAQIKKEVFDDMTQRLQEFVPLYLQEKLDKLKELIGKELTEKLEPKLFDDLYVRLYDALYVAPEEEDEFTPMI